MQKECGQVYVIISEDHKHHEINALAFKTKGDALDHVAAVTKGPGWSQYDGGGGDLIWRNYVKNRSMLLTVRAIYTRHGTVHNKAVDE